MQNGKFIDIKKKRYYIKLYFIDKNDVFKMQNKINVLVENVELLCDRGVWKCLSDDKITL